MMMTVLQLHHLSLLHPRPLSSLSHLLPLHLSPNQGNCKSCALVLITLPQVISISSICF